MEGRTSALEDRKALEHSVKVNNKLIFAIVFWGKTYEWNICGLSDIP